VTRYVIVAAMLLPAWARAGNVYYSITDLGVLPGGTLTSASAISTNGLATGSGDTNSATSQPFFWSGSAILPVSPVSSSFAFGTGVNSAGSVAGYEFSADFSTVRAFLNNGSPTYIPLLPGGTNNAATGINDPGIVVGYSSTGAVSEMAFVYSGGVASQLGTLPGGTTSRATAIDNSGNIVGRSDTGSDAALHAFLYSGGIWIDLGVPTGYQWSEATAVSSGQVAGTLNDPFGGTVAFLWTAANGMTPLGALAPGGNSQAFGVNAPGDVVGSSDGVAFLFHDGQMVDLATRVLSSSGWQFSQAVAINNLGQIVGTGTRDDQQHAFLLSPTSAADVPEPPAGLPVFGGILLLWISHRQKESQP
jgi:probable HAF family extracellular repeat protein